MRKQLDPRIPILINNNTNRSFVVLVGDKGRDQIVNFFLSQARVSARPSVLWCYKKELGFTSYRKKMEAKIKRDVKRGIREPNEQNRFEIFVTVTDIHYTYYKDSQKILGNTYGMLVLQDFEALTPNLLTRTIETVEGSGLVVLLLKTMSSLRQLYAMTMDVHARYCTSAHDVIVARFNERFILYLGSCSNRLILDDELNVLPISKGKDIVSIEAAKGKGVYDKDSALTELKANLQDTPHIGALAALASTLDQAQAPLTFVDAIAEKTLSSTERVLPLDWRLPPLAHGYANAFVTSPSSENLKTLFQFIFKGLDALGWEEHLDYDIAQSTNPGFGGAVVRYIQPQDAHVLGQAELVVIDEAAAIPLPLVTINGYAAPKARTLRKIKLTTPIRYPANDQLLCLHASVNPKSLSSGCPHPPTCEFLLSDAPAHRLFVLLPPFHDDDTHLPEPLVILQVALEGNIARNAIMDGLGRGLWAGGDLIPWLVAQFRRTELCKGCAGGHTPGSCGDVVWEHAEGFYSGEHLSPDEGGDGKRVYPDGGAGDKISAIPLLLQHWSERKPESLDYLGVSYGLTPFWKRVGYVPLYTCQTPSKLAGDASCGESIEWLGEFARDFRARFLTLLSFKFREFGAMISLSVLEAAAAGIPSDSADPSSSSSQLSSTHLSILLTPFDLKRLYTPLATPEGEAAEGGAGVWLSTVQSAILLATGLQRNSVEAEKELQLPVAQTLALFVKAVHKISKRLGDVQKATISASLAPTASKLAAAHGERTPGMGVQEGVRGKEKQRAMINTLDLSKFAIDDAGHWTGAEGQMVERGRSTVVSVKCSAGVSKVKSGDEVDTGQKEATRRGKMVKR
ncbi:DUF1726-domain-containing protein [Athelia psychrophila]|uniref:DUF1726-domain-containing protein n=1 Tax=Athelia psychrophila TaxID=1759441 RepID=A0A166TV65_9AGAM|nr:DUF1726-domain-containing protein [Fibularhizoctonia sp. CBS 109695]